MSLWQTIANKLAATVTAGALPSLFRTLGLEVSRGAGKTELGVAFTIALVALSAKMAKSDGVVTSVEIDAFRRVCRFPPGETENVRRVFDLARQDVAGYEVYASRIGRMLVDEPGMRRDVLEGLFVVAAADGILHPREEAFLRTVADRLGVSETEFAFVRSLFVANAASPYTVLGLTPSATNAEIKSRFRTLAFEHHPDRLVGRGVPPEFVAIAERKLAAINVAYESITRERGL